LIQHLSLVLLVSDSPWLSTRSGPTIDMLTGIVRQDRL
jgi:hypothetical protein